MPTPLKFAIAILMVSLSPNISRAMTVDYTFAAELTRFDTGFPAATEQFLTLKHPTVTGTLSYETNAQVLRSDPIRRVFDTSDVKLDQIDFGAPLDGRAEISNDVVRTQFTFDAVNFITEFSDFALRIRLFDETGSALSDLDIPTMLRLQDFDSLRTTLIITDLPTQKGAVYELTSLSQVAPVPLPLPIWSLILAMGMLAGYGRFNAKRS